VTVHPGGTGAVNSLPRSVRACAIAPGAAAIAATTTAPAVTHLARVRISTAETTEPAEGFAVYPRAAEVR
jgi:hypothetical protein